MAKIKEVLVIALAWITALLFFYFVYIKAKMVFNF